jgi:hypothetical protein
MSTRSLKSFSIFHVIVYVPLAAHTAEPVTIAAWADAVPTAIGSAVAPSAVSAGMNNQRRFKVSSPVRDRAPGAGARRARVMSKKPAGRLGHSIRASRRPPRSSRRRCCRRSRPNGSNHRHTLR